MLEALPGEKLFRLSKPNRSKKQQKKLKQKKSRLSRHHLLNRCRGGDCSPENLLMLWRFRHDAWHILFKNSSPERIIAVLERMIRLKGYKPKEQFCDP